MKKKLLLLGLLFWSLGIIDLEGTALQGELKAPGELSFRLTADQTTKALIQPRTHFQEALIREVRLAP